MIIVLSGGKQHGKDTFAKVLIETFPDLDFKRRAFADAMKDLTALLLDCEYEEIETLKVLEDIKITDPTHIRQGTTMRKFLQRLGESMKSLTGNNLFWCDLMARTMTANDNYLITDCRFPFEAEYLRDLAKFYGAPVVVVEIINPRVALGEDKHESEQSFQHIDFDIIIHNNGEVKDLIDIAIDLVENLEKDENV